MDTYLTYIDQFRFISGMLCLLLLLCQGILPPRPNCRLRVIMCSAVSVLAAMLYVPLARLFSASERSLFLMTGIYWALMVFLPAAFIRICYRAGWAGVFFRSLMCVAAENFMSAIVYYLFARCLFPDFDKRHPPAYLLILALSYAVMLLIAFYQLRGRLSADENTFYQEPRKTAWSYFGAYLSYHVLIFATQYSFEFVISPLKEYAEYAGIFHFLHYYLILNLILLSVIISFIMINAYEMLMMQNEKQIILQMARDRKAQYEYSKESMETIRRQAHDLKHQLRALRQIAPEERKEELARISSSIDSYDAVFRTGYEALDTILTEKSIYCRNRGIRLSCSVKSRFLQRIRVVDLYTLLGNALDNAIEAVDKLMDPEKKTISLTVRDENEMLFLQLENYYEGDLAMADGLPLTTRRDAENHGYGTKSIRNIVKSYGGSAVIRAEDNIFSLEILIPT
ncbi:MAG: GHKL domain-containing protein [Lachnospiraceae bacterium]|nr:GHKL domain-containing protein [Lachnospiraceae bacterium]